MTVMSEWLADCSTRACLRPGKRGHQEYGAESSIEPVVRVKRRSAVGAEIHRQLLDKNTSMYQLLTKVAFLMTRPDRSGVKSPAD